MTSCRPAPTPTPYYQDDLVSLFLADCRECDAWLAADVLVTDPPYGVNWQANAITWYRNRGHAGTVKDRQVARVVGDETPQLRDMVLEVFDGPAIVFGSWRVARPANVRHLLIWHKAGRNPGPNPAPWYAAHEEIYVIGEGFRGAPTSSVYVTTENRAQEPRTIGHPTPKPLSLMDRLIAKCPPGVISDPFAGSGTTLVAAKRGHHKAIGVEIEERYCEIAARRLSQDVLDFGGAA